MDQADNQMLKISLAEIKQKVNEGSSLAAALSDYPKIFDNVYINMVEAGESSGTLDVVLNRLADFTESRLKLKNKVRGAMVYPVIMIVFGTLMMGIIFAFVIPKITKVFVSMKKELPCKQRFLFGFQTLFEITGSSLSLPEFQVFSSLKNTHQKEKAQLQWHSMQLKMPLLVKLSPWLTSVVSALP